MRLPGPWMDWLSYNKSVEPLSQIRKKVVVDPIPDKLLDTPHSARYGVSAPKNGTTRNT